MEVSLIVDGELAEAVAEVLARFAPNGVAIESTAVTAAPDDSEGKAVGPLRVAAYLPVDENTEETRRRLEESLWYLGRIQPLPEPEFRPVQEKDWAEAWKQHYHPIPVGEQLMIVPAWLQPELEGRIPIVMDPGMAFGTGTHPTTQLCLEWVDRYFRREADASQVEVIDLGCGSGILSVAAIKLGASHALGIDIDPIAVDVARENAVLNGVEDRLEVGRGSLEDVQAGKFSIRQAHLVLANILAPVLIRLLDEGLGSLLLPGGSLILSGIIEDQVPGVVEAMQRNGLNEADRLQEKDWVALEGRQAA